jgi:tripartite-type tricarboxylate transporter receptor subunit TctC
MNRRTLLQHSAFAAVPVLPFAFLSTAVQAQPDQGAPLRIVTGSAAGTPGDVLGRALSGPMGRLLGQPVIVENKPGAIGTVALAAVARAKPDGSTLGILSLQTAVAPHLLAKAAADPLRDVLPLRQIATWGNVLVVQADGPFRTLDGLVTSARSQTLSYASGGNGTPAHLAAELFRQSLALQLQHIPFQGAVMGVNAVIGGHVALMFATASAVIGPIGAGKLKALAVSTPQRIAALPEVPTLAELGHPAVAFQDWLGLALPLATPTAVQSRLADAVSRALAADEVGAQLSALGFGPAAATDSAAFAALIRDESVRWGAVIREAGMRAE